MKLKDLLVRITGIALIAVFFVRMLQLSVFDIYDIRDAEAYRTISISEENILRGSIYDSNGNTLAYSIPSYNIVLSPYAIFEQKKIKEYQDKIAKTKRQKVIDDTNEKIRKLENLTLEKAKAITKIINQFYPEINETDLLLRLQKNPQSQYTCVARQVNSQKKEAFKNAVEQYNKSFTEEEKDNDKVIKITFDEDIYFESTQKRVYPYNEIGSIITGYVSEYDKASNGLEEYYDSELSGVSDRRITGRGAYSKVTSLYDEYYEGIDSVSLNTTVDIGIQKILETEIKNTQRITHAESVYGIVMETKTGRILAMSNTPGYDANDPYTPLDIETEQAEYKLLHPDKTDKEEETEEAAEGNDSTGIAPTTGGDILHPAEAEETETTQTETPLDDLHTDSSEVVDSVTIVTRTKNRCITEYFYPGSVYKAFLVAGAIEENITDEGGIYCSEMGYTVKGSAIDASGTNRVIYCADYDVHHSLDLKGILVHSCNQGAAQLAIKMGANLFYKYYEAFGFTDATNLDLGGGGDAPSPAIYHDDREYDPIDLATCAFGQNNKISEVQIACAMSALANGGKLMKPYIVDSQVDNDGNIVSKTEPTQVRQVISEQTAATMVEYLEAVCTIGGGTKAAEHNYRVAGKTGTSQLKADNSEETIGYVCSFAGFAPVSNPEITVVVTAYDPKESPESTSVWLYASDIAAPCAGKIISQSLEYLGVPYDKTAE